AQEADGLKLGQRTGDGIYAVNPTGTGILRQRPAEAQATLLRPKEGYLHLALSPDGGTLVATGLDGKHVYAFRIDKDGELAAREAYYALRLRRGQKRLVTGSLTFDRDGRLYVATATGVQVFDPTGRFFGELLPPERGKAVTDVAFGGKGRDRLFVLSETGQGF